MKAIQPSRPGLAVAVVALLHLLPARAEVVESSPNGFALQRTVHIAAAPDRVYAALIQPAKWWNSEHTFSGSAANLSLDARAGGCFCETWSGGGPARHAWGGGPWGREGG